MHVCPKEKLFLIYLAYFGYPNEIKNLNIMKNLNNFNILIPFAEKFPAGVQILLLIN